MKKLNGFVLILLLLSATSYASQNLNIGNPEYPSDAEVQEMAVEKGLLSEGLTDGIDQEGARTLHGWRIWITRTRNEKVSIINSHKEWFLDREGAMIRNSSNDYVDEINARVYNVLEAGKMDYFSELRFNWLIKSIALMDGDFDNGTDKIELLRDFIGEDAVVQLKEKFPEKYEKLIKEREGLVGGN